MGKKSRSRRQSSGLAQRRPERVRRVLALHGLLPNSRPEAFATNELIRKINTGDLADLEPACAIVASLFDIAAEDEAPHEELLVHLSELLKDGLLTSLSRQWTDNRARKIANDELTKKISCLLVYKSFFQFIVTRSEEEQQKSNQYFTDGLFLLFSQSLEEALNCVSVTAQSKYHPAAIRFIRTLFSTLSSSMLMFPLQTSQFASSPLPDLFRETPLISVALSLALGEFASEVPHSFNDCFKGNEM
eukprot:Gregarina_sp_Poly_1__9759@NODE_621_length_7097_cov_120_552347_g476_i0_p3_GENE_NODE_621_length_7097_cov_120_552347_g476_i0NODE_621_length_7097_cov_120_552347_g476_i0_p3_ORF_typecomplete_len254_score45_41Sulfolobus_pRN/PF05584_11/0_0032DUF2048/PF09752_9/0_047AlkA_N/PF06029_11/0_096AlkA_N/PF06029_11/1_1e04_NODE_621_length_7097_cov_120_552347_g476_i063357072